MPIARQTILDAITAAINEVNDQLGAGRKIEVSPTAVLFGKSGALDSLGLVNLIVAVEQQIEIMTGVTISLADERAMSQKSSPFTTVESLANYIETLTSEAS